MKSIAAVLLGLAVFSSYPADAKDSVTGCVGDCPAMTQAQAAVVLTEAARNEQGAAGAKAMTNLAVGEGAGPTATAGAPAGTAAEAVRRVGDVPAQVPNLAGPNLNGNSQGSRVPAVEGAPLPEDGGKPHELSRKTMYIGAAVLGAAESFFTKGGLIGAAAGAVGGFAAAYFFRKGDYGASFGITLGGMVGTYFGGAIGGVVGALIGGLLGHFIGKLFK